MGWRLQGFRAKARDVGAAGGCVASRSAASFQAAAGPKAGRSGSGCSNRQQHTPRDVGTLPAGGGGVASPRARSFQATARPRGRRRRPQRLRLADVPRSSGRCVAERTGHGIRVWVEGPGVLGFREHSRRQLPKVSAGSWSCRQEDSYGSEGPHIGWSPVKRCMGSLVPPAGQTKKTR